MVCRIWDLWWFVVVWLVFLTFLFGVDLCLLVGLVFPVGSRVWVLVCYCFVGWLFTVFVI